MFLSTWSRKWSLFNLSEWGFEIGQAEMLLLSSVVSWYNWEGEDSQIASVWFIDIPLLLLLLLWCHIWELLSLLLISAMTLSFAISDCVSPASQKVGEANAVSPLKMKCKCQERLIDTRIGELNINLDPEVSTTWNFGPWYYLKQQFILWIGITSQFSPWYYEKENLVPDFSYSQGLNSLC